MRRTVAVKVLRAALDDEELLLRFEAERQVLAMMDHPNIARLFDAGSMVDGRSYFVMEHVDGLPITAFCDARRLTITERLRLFATVCETVNHAHQRGIIHRDLKPSNILVLDRDGVPEPKVIDFGIAKATRPRIVDRPLLTRVDQILGTPEYMSPEQMDRGEMDVDVRSDVYSLGAILYELLCGERPFDVERLRDSGLEETLRTIRVVEPPAPSARIASNVGAATVAHARGAEPRALVRALRRELDWITMKALAKDRERRFSSGMELAQDLGRHLRHEAVAAGPPGATYRIGRFVRRHRAGVAAGAVVVVSLVALTLSMVVQARRVARERDRANEQAMVSEEVKTFLSDLFRTSDPSQSRGNEITAREILDRGVDRVHETVTDPAVRAEIVLEMGVVYRNLGLLAEATPLIREAVTLHTETFGTEDTRTLAAGALLGSLYNQQRRSTEAESLLVSALDGQRRVAGAEDAGYLAMSHDLGLVYLAQDRLDEAEMAFRQVLDVYRRRDEADADVAMGAMQNLGDTYRRMGRLEDAETFLREALDRRRRVLGSDHPRTLATIDLLGDTCRRQGRYEEAETLLRESAETKRRVLGEEHVAYWETLEKLGNMHIGRGDYAAATRYHAQVLSLRHGAFGPENPATLTSQHNLSYLLCMEGRVAEAESLASATFEARRRVLGEKHSYTVGTLAVLSLISVAAGDRDTALDRLRSVVASGHADRELLNHELMIPLRSDPEFAALLAEMQRQLDAR